MSAREDALEGVRVLREQSLRVEVLLRAAARAARAAGATPTEIADTAEVSRPTVYRWLREEARTVVDVVEVLDDTLNCLVPLLDVNTAQEVMKGLRSDKVDVKIRRYELAVRNLPVGVIDDELRAVLALAGVVVAQVWDSRQATHRWVREVCV